MSGMEVKLIKPPQMSHTCGIYIYDEAQKAETVLSAVSYIYIYIYIYSKHTRQRSDVATLSFTPVGDLQATVGDLHANRRETQSSNI